jgi:multiple sugar transport system substrate-binding protein
MSKFQIIVLCVFGFFIVAGVIGFSVYKGGSQKQTPAITIWGTLDNQTVQRFLTKTAGTQIPISYVQINPADFHTELINALAAGTGPDVILATQDELFAEHNTLLTIPYKSYPQATYDSTFIPESQLFLQPTGLLGVPFAVDPLVMYWNKVLFSNAGLSSPPTTWDALISLVPKLAVSDKAYNVSQAAVGMGDYENIDNAMPILSLLMMQTGNPIVAAQSDGTYQATLNASASEQNLAAQALTFYTQFANPVSSEYTWNRSLVDSRNLFIANQLAMYFGFASEYNTIAAKNPNLDFDVAVMPQLSAAGGPGSSLLKMTYGNLYGFAITRRSANAATAFSDIALLTTQAAAKEWTTDSGMSSARIDSQTEDPSSASSPIFIQSAMWAQGWLEPSSATANQIFQTMVDGVTSGSEDVTTAVSNAQGQLQNAL